MEVKWWLRKSRNNLSCVMRKSVSGVPTRSNTNQAVPTIEHGHRLEISDLGSSLKVLSMKQKQRR